MKIVIKIIIAALLLGCLAKMPYGYYQFIRIASCIGFAYLAYTEFEEKKNVIGLLLVAAAILFNPVAKIYFKRDVWNQIDLWIAIGLIICVIIELFLFQKKH